MVKMLGLGIKIQSVFLQILLHLRIQGSCAIVEEKGKHVLLANGVLV